MEGQLLDTIMSVQISADKMSAFLTFKRLTDDFECSLEQLEQFVQSSGVSEGIIPGVLQNICYNPLAFYKEQTLIAEGKPAEVGKDGFVQFIYDMKSKERRPAENEDGTVDFKEMTQLKNVTRGQLIAELVAPAAGEPGITVTGDEVASKEGKAARFKIGKNVVLNNEQTAMYAALDGLITMTDKDKINVFPIYEVNGDVDYKIGNIDFVGTVVIRGNVLSGFRIKSAGDIRIIGGVEGADLDAEGSIEISGGIMAGNKGFVKAGKNVKCSFIQDGNVIAGDDVLVSQSIMHSNVRAGKNVVCSGAKGLMVGGIIQAGERVKARTIGNTMSTATVVEVGVKPEHRSELLELRTKLKQHNESMDKADKALVILDQLAAIGQLTDDKMAMRIKLSATKRQSMTEVEQFRERILDIERTLEDSDQAGVDVNNTIYGGIKIVIGRYTKYIKDPLQRVSFQYLDGDISQVSYRS